MNSFNGSQVIQFTKAGGIKEDGQFQKSLAISDMVHVTNNDEGDNNNDNNIKNTTTIQFIYFVDVKEDATPNLYNNSDLRLWVFLDGENVGVTPWLGYENRMASIPTNTGIINIVTNATIANMTAGDHMLTLIPEGRVGGSNTGYLSAWGRTLVILREKKEEGESSSFAATPSSVPTPPNKGVTQEPLLPPLQILANKSNTNSTSQQQLLLPSNKKIIWYGQFYQSNRDFDALDHLNSEGAWLEYRKLPVHNIADAKVVVLSSVYAFHQFSDQEIQELRNFVNSGGRLIIAVDTDFAFCDQPLYGCGINKVSRGFGFAFGGDVSGTVVSEGGQPVDSHNNNNSDTIWDQSSHLSSVISLSDACISGILDKQNVKVLGRLLLSSVPSRFNDQSRPAAIVLNQNPDFKGGEVLGIGFSTFVGSNGDFRMLDNILNFVLR